MCHDCLTDEMGVDVKKRNFSDQTRLVVFSIDFTFWCFVRLLTGFSFFGLVVLCVVKKKPKTMKPLSINVQANEEAVVKHLVETIQSLADDDLGKGELFTLGLSG
jgi:hypothetical protein